MKERKEGQVCKCRKCGYEWISRVKSPKTCTRCKSYTWKEEPKQEDRE